MNRNDYECKICGKLIPEGTFHWQPRIRILSQQGELVNPGVGRALMHICTDCVIERAVILTGLSVYSICRCCESLIPGYQYDTPRLEIGVIKAKYEGGSLYEEAGGRSQYILCKACAKDADLLDRLYKCILKYLSEEAREKFQPFKKTYLPSQLKLGWIY